MYNIKKSDLISWIKLYDMYSWKMKHALNRFEIAKSLTQYFEGFAESFLDSYQANSKLQSSVTLRSRPDTEYKGHFLYYLS